MQSTGITLSELHSDNNVYEVIYADVNAHHTARDETANPNARDQYLVNSARHANCTFLNDPEQPSRHDPATGAFSSHDVANVHAALRDR